MRIKTITLKNFRNFVDESITLNENNIIVGCNDAGKSNLMYAIRLLLDKDLPEPNLIPTITDFNVTTNNYRYEIVLEFCEVLEECVLAKLKGHISENGKLFIKLIGTYDKEIHKFDYKIYIRFDEENLKNIEYRYYLKVLHVKYIESMRDIERYVHKEKKFLLSTSQESREESERENDERVNKITAKHLN